MENKKSEEEIKKIIDKCLNDNAHFFDTMAFRDGDLTKDEYLNRSRKWKYGRFLHPILKDLLKERRN